MQAEAKTVPPNAAQVVIAANFTLRKVRALIIVESPSQTQARCEPNPAYREILARMPPIKASRASLFPPGFVITWISGVKMSHGVT